MKKKEITSAIYSTFPGSLYESFAQAFSEKITDKLISLDVLKYENDESDKFVNLKDLAEKASPGTLFDCDSGTYNLVGFLNNSNKSLVAATNIVTKLVHSLDSGLSVRWIF